MRTNKNLFQCSQCLNHCRHCLFQCIHCLFQCIHCTIHCTQCLWHCRHCLFQCVQCLFQCGQCTIHCRQCTNHCRQCINHCRHCLFQCTCYCTNFVHQLHIVKDPSGFCMLEIDLLCTLNYTVYVHYPVKCKVASQNLGQNSIQIATKCYYYTHRVISQNFKYRLEGRMLESVYNDTK